MRCRCARNAGSSSTPSSPNVVTLMTKVRGVRPRVDSCPSTRDRRRLGDSVRRGDAAQAGVVPNSVASLSIVACSSGLTDLADCATARAMSRNHAATCAASSGGSFFNAAAAGSRSCNTLFDRGLRRRAAMLLQLGARFLRVGLGDDLADQLVRDAALARFRDGLGARARFLHHRDRAVLAGDEDGGRDEERRVRQGMPLALGERGLVGHGRRLRPTCVAATSEAGYVARPSLRWTRRQGDRLDDGDHPY